MQTSKIDLKIFRAEGLDALKSALAPLTSRAYFVGGCVRDALAGIPCHDYDVEIYDIEPARFGALMEGLGAQGVGKSFFVYKLGDFDLALPRSERKIGRGHRGFEVSYCGDEKLASARRDFTVNAMMVNIFTGELLDFHGGRGDWEKKILRVVDDKTFAQDSLRVLRAAQFCARFALKIEPKSLEIMKKIDVSDLSAERVRIELEKLFAAPRQDLGVKVLMDLGLDEQLFGVRLDARFGAKLREHFDLTRQKETFLYDLRANYGAGAASVISNLKLSNDYKKAAKQPVIRQINLRTLLEIAISMPLKDWLGLNTTSRVADAKRLGLYERKLPFKVDDAGFERLSAPQKIRAVAKQKTRAVEKALKELRIKEKS